ncbi:hypothetical protein JAAARDRAFT_196799 [Jaapia argillacea MUCL 33604]|uniref:Uncharacterized protein n=1 Tax=Jaapia argillacea MUCL 33604 TaxID=933084 RepID=A0A067PUL1_9AGAM|nr:hypothetical protein JAAARDRAFT_196799 [Jaapia argillacea MUCL 33604]
MVEVPDHRGDNDGVDQVPPPPNFDDPAPPAPPHAPPPPPPPPHTPSPTPAPQHHDPLIEESEDELLLQHGDHLPGLAEDGDAMQAALEHAADGKGWKGNFATPGWLSKPEANSQSSPGFL